MTISSYYQTLFTAQGDGTAVTAAVATTLLPAQARGFIPSEFIQFIGQNIRFRSAGRLTTGVSPGTMTLDFRIGATNAVWTTGAMTLVASQTNFTWLCDVTATVRSVGAASTVMAIGNFYISTSVIAASGGQGPSWLFPATAPAAGGSFDCTATNQLDHFVTFSATVNSITCHQFQVDAQV